MADDDFQKASSDLKLRREAARRRAIVIRDNERDVQQRTAAQSSEYSSQLDKIKYRRQLHNEGPSTALKFPVNDTFVYRRTITKIAVQSNPPSRNAIRQGFIHLPQSVLQHILATSPINLEVIVFHLFSRETFNISYAPAVEFTAEDDTIILSDDILKTLFGAQKSDKTSIEKMVETLCRRGVIITLVDLPKGESVKLEVHNSSMSNISDLQEFLQAALSTVTVIFENQQLELNAPERHLDSVLIRVLNVHPSEAALIVDCDLAVDLQFPSGDWETKESFESLTLGNVITGTVSNENPSKQYRIELPRVLWNEAKETRSILVNLISLTDSFVDVFASFFPFREATMHRNYFSNLTSDANKTLTINRIDYITTVLNNQQFLEPPSHIIIGVEYVESTVAFQLSVCVKAENLNNTPSIISLSEDMSLQASMLHASTDDTERCRNCRHSIPKNNIELHEVHCFRFLTKCSICDCVLRRSEASLHVHCPVCGLAMMDTELSKHVSAMHRSIQCSCGLTIESRTFNLHKKNECPDRMVLCRYCGVFVTAGIKCPLSDWDTYLHLTPHEAKCGSKTEECSVCHQLIIKKNFEYHWSLVHDLPEAEYISKQICPVCRESNFNSLDRWKNHLQTHTSITEVSSTIVSEKQATQKCQNTYCSRLLNEEKQFEQSVPLCSICKKLAFKDKKELEITNLKKDLLTLYLSQLTSGCMNDKGACNSPADVCCHSDDINNIIQNPTAIAIHALKKVRETEETGNWYICMPCKK